MDGSEKSTDGKENEYRGKGKVREGKTGLPVQNNFSNIFNNTKENIFYCIRIYIINEIYTKI